MNDDSQQIVKSCCRRFSLVFANMICLWSFNSYGWWKHVTTNLDTFLIKLSLAMLRIPNPRGSLGLGTIIRLQSQPRVKQDSEIIMVCFMIQSEMLPIDKRLRRFATGYSLSQVLAASADGPMLMSRNQLIIGFFGHPMNLLFNTLLCYGLLPLGIYLIMVGILAVHRHQFAHALVFRLSIILILCS